MRRFLHILGTIAFLMIVATAIGLGTVVYRGHALDAESKAFVDNAVPAIATKWSKQKFLDRADPELSQRIKPEDVTTLFERFSQLDPLVVYQGAKGEAAMSYMMGAGGAVSAIYVAHVRCQNGDATIKLGLVKRNGRWMIHDFHVDPEPGSPMSRGA